MAAKKKAKKKAKKNPRPLTRDEQMAKIIKEGNLDQVKPRPKYWGN
jgi:hypothetical protein